MRPDPRHGPAIPRRVVGFHRDEEGHWVADLECGHTRHVRHDPPWQDRPWTATEEGRRAFAGRALGCVDCGRADVPDGPDGLDGPAREG